LRLAAARTFHNESKGSDDGKHERHDSKQFYEGNHHRLSLDHPEHRRISRMSRRSEIHSPRRHSRSNLFQHSYGWSVVRRDVRAENVDVSLRVSTQHRGNRRNSHAASKVARQVEQACRIAHVFTADRTHGGGCQWNKYQAHRHTLKELRPKEIP